MSRNYDRDPLHGDYLIADYPLDEGVGIYTYDRSTTHLYGTLTGTPPSWVIETLAGGQLLTTVDLVLAGTDHIDLGTDARWDDYATTNEITLEMIFYSDATLGTIQTLFASETAGVGTNAEFPQLMIMTDGKLQWRPCMDGGAGHYIETASAVTAAWTHAVVSYSDSDDLATIMVNGAAEIFGTMTDTTTLTAAGAEDVYIGTRWNTNSAALENYFDGHIASMTTWSRRFNERERRLLWERARTRLGL